MKKIKLMVLFSLIVMCLFSCGNKAESLFEEARNAYDAGDFETTIEMCTDIIDNYDEEYALAYELRGDAYVESGEYSLATLDYDIAIYYGINCETKKAEAFYALGDIDNAINSYVAYLDYTYDDVDVYLKVYDLYTQQGNIEKAREIKLKGYEYTGDERLKITALSKVEAQSIGGVYILSNDNYYLLDVTSERYGDSNFYIDPETEDIPVLGKNDKLVFFSKNELEESYPIYPVINSGSTTYAKFGDPDFYGDNVQVFVYSVAIDEFNYEELKFENNELSDKRFTINNIDNINGKSYVEFYNEYIQDVDGGMVDMNANENIIIEYYSGTEFKQIELPININYYHIGNEISSKGILTKEGYAELDVSNLENGKYIIPFEMNKKMIMYFSDVKQFIFEVAR